MFCSIFWCKSCVAFWVEPASEIVVFPRSPSPFCVARPPLGIFRFAIPTEPHLERPCFEPRKTIYRLSVRHVSQRKMLIVEGENLCSLYNALVISRLCNSAENRVFQPNPSVVATNDVDFSIVCCHNSHSSPNKTGLVQPSQ